MAFDPEVCRNSTSGPAPSDAGIAGTGVLLSFFITAAFALVLSLSIILSEFKGKTSNIRRRLLSSYSDQQILQGIGIHAIGLAKRDSMIPYHFFIIWCLGLISQAVHNATLLSLVHDFRRDWVLRWFRQFLMFVNMGLSVVYGVFILRGVQTGVGTDPVPISCVWHVDGDGQGNNSGLSYVGTIVVMAANVIVFAFASWYLHARIHRFARTVKLVGTLLMGATAAGAIIRCALHSDAIGNGPDGHDVAGGEAEWGFGQLLSMIVLLFPLVSMVEILRGDLKMTPCDLTDGGTCPPPMKKWTNETEMNRFDPNPFWGSQTSLFKKDEGQRTDGR